MDYDYIHCEMEHPYVKLIDNLTINFIIEEII